MNLGYTIEQQKEELLSQAIEMAQKLEDCGCRTRNVDPRKWLQEYEHLRIQELIEKSK